MDRFAESRLTEACAEVALSAAEIDLVAARAGQLGGEVEAVAKRYYAHLATTEMGRLLSPERTDHLLVARIEHWRLLIRGDIHAVATDYVERFGKRLVEAGFPVRIFVVASHWFAAEFTALVDRAADIPAALKADLRAALLKLAFLDLLLANAAREVVYLD